MQWEHRQRLPSLLKQAGGEYVLALKGNQKKLSDQVAAWFEQAIARNWHGVEYDYHKTVETGHHRIETRQVWAGSIDKSTTTVASAKLVGGLNYYCHGQANPSIVEHNDNRSWLLPQLLGSRCSATQPGDSSPLEYREQFALGT